MTLRPSQDGTNRPRATPFSRTDPFPSAQKPTEGDLLAALDWRDYQCQNLAGCTRRAVYEIHLHAIDTCNHDCDPFGNLVALLCPWCMFAVQADAQQRIVLRNYMGVHECAACGAPMSEIGDLLRELKLIS